MILENCEPKRVFHHFEAISQIPRGSGNEKAVSDFIADFAGGLGLKYVQDDSHNLIIYKPGTSGYENSEPIILQGHLDMVCEKNADTIHDFLKDPIKLYVDGDYLKAKGTTLGADNGIAVAFCMALLEESTIAHPPLEIVLTSDEEAGMTGAFNLDGNLLKGRRMINLDSGSVGTFTAGSAAASTVEFEIPTMTQSGKGLEAYTVTVKGLQGGHSGGDIKLERGNAIRILGSMLNAMDKAALVYLVDIQGGMKVNAIPREASATIAIEPESKATIEEAFRAHVAKQALFFRVADPDISITMEPTHAVDEVLDFESGAGLIWSLLLLPNGVQTMSRDIEGLVSASCNIGVIETLDESIKVSCMPRGASAEYIQQTEDKINALAQITEAEVMFAHRSPAWAFNPDSPILKKVASYYKEIHGDEPKIVAMHGGLECGIFAEKLPGLDIVAMGPNMYDLHTPQERLSISSTEVIWKLLCGVLGEMK
ncbi:MAG: aminoacyl-histidine dipeptidase [Defluviitaleaceae bacterium]|nr:aminoacyl-histidine dipeptidase [Defluviitaleaceae bacterium]